jgi:hypothetical protein
MWHHMHMHIAEKISGGHLRACVLHCLLPACRENVQRVAKDGYLFVTWANHHYTDFALTWVQHMKMQNITNFMVGAMDDKILASLARRSIPTFSMQSGEQGGLQWQGSNCSRSSRSSSSCKRRGLLLIC